MLIPIERLLLRARHVRTRADELVALNGRVRAARAERPGDEERAAAAELRALGFPPADTEFIAILTRAGGR